MRHLDPELLVRTLGLLLIDDFALMSYASLIEPFRAANVIAGSELYRWKHISVDGRPSLASNGATVLADLAVGQPIACDSLFVFAGGDPTGFTDPATFAWLRSIASTGTVIGGISAGPFLLARAGLLDGYRSTIHWEHRMAFAEAFPTLISEPGLYVIDRRRVTCAGGTAGLDLATEMIEREQGHELSAKVSDWFIRTAPRSADQPQRLSLRDRYGISNDRVLKVLAYMKATTEVPVDRAQLAVVAGVSLRQLERLFLQHLGSTVAASYVRVRLELGEQLLRTTGMSVTDAGLACGYKSTSHFSRSYKNRYGRAPGSENRLADSPDYLRHSGA